jgi:hypothetical protein
MNGGEKLRVGRPDLIRAPLKWIMRVKVGKKLGVRKMKKARSIVSNVIGRAGYIVVSRYVAMETLMKG